MKKSTLVLLLLAVLAGGLTWYFEIKHPHKEDVSPDAAKPAFSFHSADVTSIDVGRPGQNVRIERRGGDWQITQPVNNRADHAVVDNLVDSISSAMVQRKFSAKPDVLATYGLAQPAVTVQVGLKDGGHHRIALGSKDFDGANVYAQVDDASDVFLFPSSLLTAADKALPDLRDNAVLGFQSPNVVWFELKDAEGDFIASKHNDEWRLEKPVNSYADNTQVLGLLAQMNTNRITAVASETADNLAKYGLNNPSVTFTARDKDGKSYVLLVGKKIGDDYYAQDTSRAMIFQIKGDLYKKLDVGMPELRDKIMLHVTQSDLTKVEIRNANQTLVCARRGDDWFIQQPPAQAGKEAMVWKFLTPLLNGRATEVLDHPSASVTASLAKPAIEGTLTPKSGKPVHVAISQPDGNFVYARSDAAEGIFKMEKQIYDDLNFRAADVVMAAPGNRPAR